MRKYRTFARDGALAGLCDTTIKIGQFRRGEARTVRHALAEREFGVVAQFLHRRGRCLDDIAELRMMADLQAGDAVALRVVELERGEHATAVIAQCSFSIEFGVEAGTD